MVEVIYEVSQFLMVAANCLRKEDYEVSQFLMVEEIYEVSQFMMVEANYEVRF